jgi:hypothetical protein
VGRKGLPAGPGFVRRGRGKRGTRWLRGPKRPARKMCSGREIRPGSGSAHRIPRADREGAPASRSSPSGTNPQKALRRLPDQVCPPRPCTRPPCGRRPVRPAPPDLHPPPRPTPRARPSGCGRSPYGRAWVSGWTRSLPVIPGLGPDPHLVSSAVPEDVDGRDEPGHDGKGLRETWTGMAPEPSSPTGLGLARDLLFSAQVGNTRLAVGRRWRWGCERHVLRSWRRHPHPGPPLKGEGTRAFSSYCDS